MKKSFKVIYLIAAKPATLIDGISLEAAQTHLRRLKRQGLTTWIETNDGDFVPVKGAARKPAHL